MDIIFLIMWLGVLAAVFLPMQPQTKQYIGIAELVLLIIWLAGGFGVWGGWHYHVR